MYVLPPLPTFCFTQYANYLSSFTKRKQIEHNTSPGAARVWAKAAGAMYIVFDSLAVPVVCHCFTIYGPHLVFCFHRRYGILQRSWPHMVVLIPTREMAGRDESEKEKSEGKKGKEIDQLGFRPTSLSIIWSPCLNSVFDYKVLNFICNLLSNVLLCTARSVMLKKLYNTDALVGAT